MSSTLVNFRTSASSPFFGYIDGTSNVYNSGTYPFEVAYQCVQPISYEWSVSTDGFNFGSPIGYSEQIYPYLSSANNGLYYLRCRITLPNSQVVTPTRYVSVNICDGCRQGAKEPVEEDVLTLMTSLNPASGNTVNINFRLPEEAAVTATLTDVRSIPVRMLSFGKLTQGSYQRRIEVAGLDAGLYIISLQAGTQVRSQKVLLTK